MGSNKESKIEYSFEGSLIKQMKMGKGVTLPFFSILIKASYGLVSMT